jgi:hypothetical protein
MNSENVYKVYGFEYPIVRAYSSISSLVNLSCPFQFAELLRGRNVLCPRRLLRNISSIAGGLISPKISSGLTACCRFNWATRTGDSAHDGTMIDGFFGESSSESEYLLLVNSRELKYSESISGRMMDSLGGYGVSLVL